MSKIYPPHPIAVQTVSFITGAVDTGVILIPFDDTIPQNTEGDQYLTLNIKPKNSLNKLVFSILLNLDGMINAQTTVALFQDANVDALCANSLLLPTAGGVYPIPLQYTMLAGSTNTLTFNVRAGSAAVGTTTLNGASSLRKFGGVLNSSIIIQEFTK